MLERVLADMRATWDWMVRASPGARLVEADGVWGSVVPAAPERSVFNSVGYRDAPALERALPELAGAYDRAGVIAWTVWVPAADAGAAELLAGAGHALDAEPLAMEADLRGLELPGPGDLDWTADGDVAEVAQLNDLAYGYDDGPFARALREPAGAHVYVARADGRPACGIMMLDRDDSVSVMFVATSPAAQGRGLATRLLARALADARERGCATATLEATKAGAPLYERLGFRALGRLQMWERRAPLSRA